jgi:flagellar assembly factor FliW
MKTIQSRFGELTYDPEKTLLFSQGLIGFEHLREFVVMPNEGGDPLFCIQSVDDPRFAFLLTDPRRYFPSYTVAPSGQDRVQLGIGPDDECLVLAMITVHLDKSVTLNLAAPVFYAPATDRAIQVVLEGMNYSARTPVGHGE